MAESRKLLVFLCHASEDDAIVSEINEKLKSYSWIDPWFDNDDLLPGQDFKEKISQALHHADAVLICLSSRSVNKEGYVQTEIQIAQSYALEKPPGTIYLIPLLLDECDVPFKLQHLYWVKYSSDDDFRLILGALKTRAEQVEARRNDTSTTAESKPGKKIKLTPRPIRVGFRSAIKMFLGVMLPIFACLIVFVVAVNRKYTQGIWTNGDNEAAFTLLVFFVLLTLSFILFMDGFSKITLFTMRGLGQWSATTVQDIRQRSFASTQKKDKKETWIKSLQGMWQAFSIQQFGALRATIETFRTSENWLEPEFKERLDASLRSLFVPGWGLWRRGRKLLAFIFLAGTTLGYIIDALPAGILIHLMVIVLSGVLDVPEADETR